jgi:hypothetical protein
MTDGLTISTALAQKSEAIRISLLQLKADQIRCNLVTIASFFTRAIAPTGIVTESSGNATEIAATTSKREPQNLQKAPLPRARIIIRSRGRRDARACLSKIHILCDQTH